MRTDTCGAGKAAELAESVCDDLRRGDEKAFERDVAALCECSAAGRGSQARKGVSPPDGPMPIAWG